MAGGIAIAVQMAAPWINPRAAGPPRQHLDHKNEDQKTPVDRDAVAARSLA